MCSRWGYSGIVRTRVRQYARCLHTIHYGSKGAHVVLRRFDESIEVRVEDEPVDSQAPGTPRAFLWRGRVYAVRGIDGH